MCAPPRPGALPGGAGGAAVASLAAAARASAPRGRTTFVLSAQEVFGWVVATTKEP